jgi:hypothetical protein
VLDWPQAPIEKLAFGGLVRAQGGSRAFGCDAVLQRLADVEGGICDELARLLAHRKLHVGQRCVLQLFF